MRDAPPGRMMVLDGMRGVAALIVVLHHAGPATTGWALLPRGYLAVDFFFMLSGFVMTRTYEARLRDGLGASSFMATRLRRLYPTIALAILLGALIAVIGGMPPAVACGLMIAELLFLPSLGSGERGVFRLDGPQWSLLFELIANAAHALVLHRIRSTLLVLSAMVTLGVLILLAQRSGTLAFGDRGANLLSGVPRVLFPYVTGVLLGRLMRDRDLRPDLNGTVPIVLLGLALVAAGLVPGRWDGWWIDIGAVAIAFPLLILWGAQAGLPARHATAAWAIGALSYPLYAVHMPVLQLALIGLGPLLGRGMPLLIVVSTMAIAGARVLQQMVARVSQRPLPGLAAILRDPREPRKTAI